MHRPQMPVYLLILPSARAPRLKNYPKYIATLNEFNHRFSPKRFGVRSLLVLWVLPLHQVRFVDAKPIEMRSLRLPVKKA
ncbi:hypothetical protein NG796_22125 [Laspinema sp. A4]|nr:hypothetical protein [Laspinema sp. D2d]